MRRTRCLPTLCVLVCLAPFLNAQDFTRETEMTPEARDTVTRSNNASILFERNINTFNWLGRAAMDTTAQNIHIRLFGRFTTSVTFLDGSPGRQTLKSDQQNLSLRLRRSLTDNVATHAQWSSLVYSDNKSVGLSTASIHSVLGGIEYLPFRFVSLTPLVGYRWDNQAGFYDKGMSYIIGAQADSLITDGYAFSATGQFREDRLDPRTLVTHFATLGMQKVFQGRTRDSLEFGFRQNRREFA